MEGADALVLLTEWNEFRALDLGRVGRLLAEPLVIDLRNIYQPAEMAAAGLAYVSIGRPPASARPENPGSIAPLLTLSRAGLRAPHSRSDHPRTD